MTVRTASTPTAEAALYAENLGDQPMLLQPPEYPYWTSSKRHSLVVLTASAAADPEKRRKVHELMGRLARGVSTWDIAAESAPGFAGPFRVGEGRLGMTPIGTVAV